MINEPSDNEDDDPEYTPGRNKITMKSEVPISSSYATNTDPYNTTVAATPDPVKKTKMKITLKRSEKSLSVTQKVDPGLNLYSSMPV